MLIITRIIARAWIKFFIGSNAILFLLLSLGHLINSLLRDVDDLKTSLYLLLLEIPVYAIKIIPISSMVASLFSINFLKSKNELVAIFASGYSRRHFIISLIMLSTVVGIFLFYINAYIAPFSKHKHNELRGIKSATDSTFNAHKDFPASAISSGKIWFRTQDYFFSYGSFDRSSNTLYGLNLYYYNNKNHLIKEVSAAYAENIQNNSWRLFKVITIDRMDELKQFPLYKYSDQEVTTLNESLKDFHQINSDIATMNIWKIYSYIKVLQENKVNDSEYSVTFWEKFSTSSMCVLLTLIASVSLFTPNRRGSSFGKNVAFVLGFAFFYWFVASYLFTLGQTNKIPALTATFGLPTLFTLYLISIFIYHRRLR